MRARVATKLASKRGASLSMALMLFLVCTVVASVVITAGSAAAGRLSQLKKADKSYYNVTSAANLFWQQLNEAKGVELTYKCDVAKDAEGNLSVASPANYALSIDGTSATLGSATTLATLFQATAIDLAFNTKSDLTNPTPPIAATDVASALTELEGDIRLLGKNNKHTYNVFKITTEDDRFEDVNVAVTREQDGALRFQFYEDDPDSFNVTISTMIGIDDQGPTTPRAANENGTYQLEHTVVISWDAEAPTLGGDAS